MPVPTCSHCGRVEDKHHPSYRQDHPEQAAQIWQGYQMSLEDCAHNFGFATVEKPRVASLLQFKRQTSSV